MPLRTAILRTALMTACVAIAVFAAGCASPPPGHYFESHKVDPERVIFAVSTPTAQRPRELRMYSGRDGVAIGWDDLMRAIAWADIIVVGEQHDDAIGHAVELAIVDDVLSRWRGSALSLEMHERDEQRVIDDFLDGVIDANALSRLTLSDKGTGESRWEVATKPLIESAKSHHSRVIAANAPRRYVTLARTGGYDRLKKLPTDRRELFDLPKADAPAEYRQRFEDFMREAAEESEKAATQPATAPAEGSASTQPSSQPASDAAGMAGHGGEVTPQRLEAGFRSQRLWDATMSASAVKAWREEDIRKVIQIIGQFHSDSEGGTVAEIRARAPEARLLVISLQRDEVSQLRDEDRGIADIVIYTGKPPEEEQEKKVEEPKAVDVQNQEQPKR